MQRRIITTADGSTTIQIEDWNEQYHSLHGAIQEAKHVFIKHGFHYFISTVTSTPVDKFQSQISILEIAFGTGLNAFITLLEAEKLQKEEEKKKTRVNRVLNRTDVSGRGRRGFVHDA